MAAATSSKTSPPVPPTATDAAMRSFETATRMAAMPPPLDQAAGAAHAAATVAACEAATAALRRALSEVEAQLSEESSRGVDTSRVAAAAAEYARASAERVSAQAVAETLCPDAIEAAKMGTTKGSSAARGLSARVKLLRRMAEAAYKTKPEAGLEAAKAAHASAVDALSVFEAGLVAGLPKAEPRLTEAEADLYRCAMFVRAAELAGEDCPPQSKERAAVAQAKLDAAADADVKAAAGRAAFTLPSEEEGAAEQAKSRERLFKAGAMVAERGRLQLAISQARKGAEAAKAAVVQANMRRHAAEAGLAEAQEELDAVASPVAAPAEAAAAAASDASDEDPSAAAWGASAARARFDAAVRAEAAALTSLRGEQAQEGRVAVSSLRTAQRDLQARLERVEALSAAALTAASGVS